MGAHQVTYLRLHLREDLFQDTQQQAAQDGFQLGNPLHTGSGIHRPLDWQNVSAGADSF
jgi:hypothetical protein